MIGIAPIDHVDQPRRGGGGAADGVNERKIPLQQLFADDGVDGGGVARGELARRLFELRRAHVVCRRIDQIARQRHRVDDARKIVAIEALRQIELDRPRLGLAVAGEAIKPERERKRGEPRIVRLIGEAVGAVRQMLRQAAGKKRVRRFVGPSSPNSTPPSELLPFFPGNKRVRPAFGSNPAASAKAESSAPIDLRTSG